MTKNYFDQFDEPAEKPVVGNQEIKPVVQPEPAQGANPFDEFDVTGSMKGVGGGQRKAAQSLDPNAKTTGYVDAMGNALVRSWYGKDANIANVEYAKLLKRNNELRALLAKKYEGTDQDKRNVDEVEKQFQRSWLAENEKKLAEVEKERTRLSGILSDSEAVTPAYKQFQQANEKSDVAGATKAFFGDKGLNALSIGSQAAAESAVPTAKSLLVGLGETAAKIIALRRGQGAAAAPYIAGAGAAAQGTMAGRDATLSNIDQNFKQHLQSKGVKADDAEAIKAYARANPKEFKEALELAINTGTAAGVAEGAVTGGFSLIPGMAELKTAAKNPVAKFLISKGIPFMVEAAKEGGEEAVVSGASQLASMLAGGKNKFDWSQPFTSFLIGAASGAVSSGSMDATTAAAKKGWNVTFGGRNVTPEEQADVTGEARSAGATPPPMPGATTAGAPPVTPTAQPTATQPPAVDPFAALGELRRLEQDLGLARDAEEQAGRIFDAVRSQEYPDQDTFNRASQAFADALAARIKAEDAFNAAQVNLNNPQAAPAPAPVPQNGNAPAFPPMPDKATSTSAQMAAWQTSAQDWTKKYGQTHNLDGTPIQRQAAQPSAPAPAPAQPTATTQATPAPAAPVATPAPAAGAPSVAPGTAPVVNIGADGRGQVDYVPQHIPEHENLSPTELTTAHSAMEPAQAANSVVALNAEAHRRTSGVKPADPAFVQKIVNASADILLDLQGKDFNTAVRTAEGLAKMMEKQITDATQNPQTRYTQDQAVEMMYRKSFFENLARFLKTGIGRPDPYTLEGLKQFAQGAAKKAVKGALSDIGDEIGLNWNQRISQAKDKLRAAVVPGSGVSETEVNKLRNRLKAIAAEQYVPGFDPNTIFQGQAPAATAQPAPELTPVVPKATAPKPEAKPATPKPDAKPAAKPTEKPKTPAQPAKQTAVKISDEDKAQLKTIIEEGIDDEGEDDFNPNDTIHPILSKIAKENDYADKRSMTSALKAAFGSAYEGSIVQQSMKDWKASKKPMEWDKKVTPLGKTGMSFSVIPSAGSETSTGYDYGSTFVVFDENGKFVVGGNLKSIGEFMHIGNEDHIERMIGQKVDSMHDDDLILKYGKERAAKIVDALYSQIIDYKRENAKDSDNDNAGTIVFHFGEDDVFKIQDGSGREALIFELLGVSQNSSDADIASAFEKKYGVKFVDYEDLYVSYGDKPNEMRFDLLADGVKRAESKRDIPLSTLTVDELVAEIEYNDLLEKIKDPSKEASDIREKLKKNADPSSKTYEKLSNRLKELNEAYGKKLLSDNNIFKPGEKGYKKGSKIPLVYPGQTDFKDLKRDVENMLPVKPMIDSDSYGNHRKVLSASKDGQETFDRFKSLNEKARAIVDRVLDGKSKDANADIDELKRTSEDILKATIKMASMIETIGMEAERKDDDMFAAQASKDHVFNIGQGARLVFDKGVDDGPQFKRNEETKKKLDALEAEADRLQNVINKTDDVPDSLYEQRDKADEAVRSLTDSKIEPFDVTATVTGDDGSKIGTAIISFGQDRPFSRGQYEKDAGSSAIKVSFVKEGSKSLSSDQALNLARAVGHRIRMISDEHYNIVSDLNDDEKEKFGGQDTPWLIIMDAKTDKVVLDAFNKALSADEDTRSDIDEEEHAVMKKNGIVGFSIEDKFPNSEVFYEDENERDTLSSYNSTKPFRILEGVAESLNKTKEFASINEYKADSFSKAFELVSKMDIDLDLSKFKSGAMELLEATGANKPKQAEQTTEKPRQLGAGQGELIDTSDAFNLTGENVAATQAKPTDTTAELTTAGTEPAYVAQARTQLAKLEKSGKGLEQQKTLRDTIAKYEESQKAKPAEPAPSGPTELSSAIEEHESKFNDEIKDSLEGAAQGTASSDKEINGNKGIIPRVEAAIEALKTNQSDSNIQAILDLAMEAEELASRHEEKASNIEDMGREDPFMERNELIDELRNLSEMLNGMAEEIQGLTGTQLAKDMTRDQILAKIQEVNNQKKLETDAVLANPTSVMKDSKLIDEINKKYDQQRRKLVAQLNKMGAPSAEEVKSSEVEKKIQRANKMLDNGVITKSEHAEMISDALGEKKPAQPEAKPVQSEAPRADIQGVKGLDRGIKDQQELVNEATSDDVRRERQRGLDEMLAVKEALKDKPTDNRRLTTQRKKLREMVKENTFKASSISGLLFAQSAAVRDVMNYITSYESQTGTAETEAERILEPFTDNEPADVTEARKQLSSIIKNMSKGEGWNAKRDAAEKLIAQFEAESALLDGTATSEIDFDIISDDALNEFMAKFTAEEVGDELYDRVGYELATREDNKQRAASEFGEEGEPVKGDLIADIEGIIASSGGTIAIPTLPAAFGHQELLGLAQQLGKARFLKLARLPKRYGKVDAKRAETDLEYKKNLKDAADGMLSDLAQALASRGWTQVDPTNANTDVLIDLIARAANGETLTPQGGVGGVAAQVDMPAEYGVKRLYKTDEGAIDENNPFLESGDTEGDARENATKKPFSYPNTREFNEWTKGNQYGYRPRKRMPMLVRSVDALRNFNQLVEGFVTTVFHGTKSEGRSFDQFKPGSITYFVADRNAAGAYAKDSPDMYFVRSSTPAVLTSPNAAIQAYEKSGTSTMQGRIGKDLIDFYNSVASDTFRSRDDFLSALDNGLLFDVDGRGQKGIQHQMSRWFLEDASIKYDSVVFNDSTVSTESPTIVVSNDGHPKLGADKPNTGIKAASNFGAFSSIDPRFNFSESGKEFTPKENQSEHAKAVISAMRSVQNKVMKTKDAVNVIIKALSGSKHQRTIEAIGILKKIASSKVGGLEVKFTDVYAETKAGTTISGVYSETAKVIEISIPAIIKKTTSGALAAEAIAHEIVHYHTVGAIDNNQQFRAEISSLMAKTINWMTKNGIPLGQYGLKNQKEFLAEGLSNKKFRDILKQIPANQNVEPPASGSGNTIRNLFDKLVKSIKDALSKLGIDFGSDTVLERVIELYSKAKSELKDGDYEFQYAMGLSRQSARRQSNWETQSRLARHALAEGGTARVVRDEDVSGMSSAQSEVDAQNKLPGLRELLSPNEDTIMSIMDASEEQSEDPDLFSEPRKGASGLRVALDIVTLRYLSGISAKAHQNASRFKDSKVMKRIANIIHARPGTDSNAFERDMPTAITTARTKFTNKLNKIMEPLRETLGGFKDTDQGTARQQREEVYQALTDMITGRRPLTGGAIGKAAIGLKQLLAQLHQYRMEAGEKMGEIEDYFPAVYDSLRIGDNRTAFVRDAKEAYILTINKLGEDEIAKLLGIDVDAYNDLLSVDPESVEDSIAEVAEEKAKELYNMHVRGGAAESFDSIFGDRKSGPESPLLKRKFGKEAQDIMRKWQVNDPFRVVGRYISSAAKRTEVVRRFGADGKKWSGFSKAMERDGIPYSVIEETADLVKKAAGIELPARGKAAQTYIDTITLVTAASAMGKGFMNNLVEPISIGIRAGNVGSTLRAYAETWARFLREVAALSPALKAKMGDTFWTQYGNEIGTIHNSFEDAWMTTHSIDMDAENADPRFRWLTNRIYKANLMDASEVAKQQASHAIGFSYINRVAELFSGNHWTAKLGLNAKQSATDNLNELGIPPSKHEEFSKWCQKLSQMKDSERMIAMTSEGEMSKLHQEAMIRFSMQSSVRTNRAHKPVFQDTELGKTYLQLMNFSYAYAAEVNSRLYDMIKRALMFSPPGKDYSLYDRLRMIAPIVIGALSIAAYRGLLELKDMLYPTESAKQRAKDPAVVKWLNATSYAGLLGPKFEMIMKTIKRDQAPGGPTGQMVVNTGRAAKSALEALAEGKSMQQSKITAAKAAIPIGKSLLVAGASAAHPVLGAAAVQATNAPQLTNKLIPDKDKGGLTPDVFRAK